MKKLLLAGALVYSTLSFATTKEDVKAGAKKETETSKKTDVTELTKEQKETLALIIKWWGVSFTNSCGEEVTAYFQSDNPDGSPAFIRELAYAVNTFYEDC
ncbi:hypothetical protein [Chryseobacterium gambrini]|uniref:hypothetical protein n=1 Tax=Chryseobacterium gambrini TaxID=373672 RepID=UPI003D0E8A87